jgi:hypothetical protein
VRRSIEDRLAASRARDASGTIEHQPLPRIQAHAAMGATADHNRISSRNQTRMSQGKSGFDFSEPQRLGSALLNSALFGPGTEAVLAAQRALVSQTETMLSGWMSRRREAMQDTQRLVTRLRDCRDMREAMQAQQAWLMGEMRRLAEDATSCQQAMLSGGMTLAAATPQADAANDGEAARPLATVRPKPAGPQAGAA